MRKRDFLRSIRGKLLLALSLILALLLGLGLYSYSLLSSAGGIVVETYDKPLMAINYARAASLDFALMQADVLRAQIASAAERRRIAADLTSHVQSFFADLGVARERSAYHDEQTEISRINALVRSWIADYRDVDVLKADAGRRQLDHAVLNHLDMLVELNADHSFVDRRKSVWAIRRFKYAVSFATVLAALLVLLIGYVILRRVVRPISVATDAARQIGDGDLDCVVPKGGSDEAGTLLHTLGWMRDQIRDALTREAALRALAEIRLADALESASEAVILATAEGTIVSRNAQVQQFFPVSAGDCAAASDLIATLAQMENALEPSSGPPLTVLLGAGRASEADVIFERQLRTGRWVRFAASRTRDEGYILLISDFSAVKEREAALEQARLSAEQASAAKSHFLATMSHELRTPLNAIIGFSEMIHEQMLGPVGNAAYADYAGDILSSGRGLLNIINSVIDLTRYESKSLSLRCSELLLREVLDTVVDAHMITAEAGQVTLELIPPPDGEMIEGDPARLKQIFANLLSNAIKFTQPGGRVTIAATRRAQSHVVRIEDSGIGMTAEDLAVAMAPFGQVDNRLARRYEGIGLGLPLARALADLHGGSLSLSSVRGKGTVVEVVLPVSRQPAGDLAA